MAEIDMTFTVGQKVVCVDASVSYADAPYPTEGSIYTVSAIHKTGAGVRIFEITLKSMDWYRASRFRPIKMAEIGEPQRRRVLVPDETPAPAPVEPVKVPKREKEPA